MLPKTGRPATAQPGRCPQCPLPGPSRQRVLCSPISERHTRPSLQGWHRGLDITFPTRLYSPRLLLHSSMSPTQQARSTTIQAPAIWSMPDPSIQLSDARPPSLALHPRALDRPRRRLTLPQLSLRWHLPAAAIQSETASTMAPGTTLASLTIRDLERSFMSSTTNTTRRPRWLSHPHRLKLTSPWLWAATLC
jgi:hypothetical protein